MIYEVHTRQWLAELGVQTLADVPDAALDALAALRVRFLWLMGMWPTGPRARAIAIQHMKKELDVSLPGWTPDDVYGSTYSVADYRVAPDLGDDAALAALRARLHRRGIALMLDFVPNHIGIDHAWVKTEHVVASLTKLPDSFADGRRFVAHGKDPYFPGWIDTAQIDYRRAATRAAMRDVLASIADRCDAARCDMAMLVLPDIFEKTWQHVPSEEAAHDFWTSAITHVKQRHRDFTLVAEAYWGLEARLCSLGFDYAYDKELYDRVVHDKPVAHPLLDHARCVHFLENHDEPRAAATLASELHRAAALLVLGLPGLALIHHGQLDGARIFSRIQTRRRAAEKRDPAIRAMYDALFAALRASSVGQGTGRVLTPAAAWVDNATHASFTVVKWPRDLVVVNLAPRRAQCRVDVREPGKYRLVDRLGSERWERDLAQPLFLDLPAYGAQLFELQRIT